jgi:hypothetical protein
MPHTIVPLRKRGVDDVWGDDRTFFNYGGKLHACGVAVRAVASGDVHLVLNYDGTRAAKFTVGYSPRAGSAYSMILGVPVIVGGVATTFGNTDVWKFDQTIAGLTTASWQMINANFTAAIGNRVFPFYTDLGGRFYIGGGQNQTTLYSTTDFITWDFEATLPTEMIYISAATACAFNGKIYIFGGCTDQAGYGSVNLYAGTLRGNVWVFDPSDKSFTKILTDRYHFAQFWGNAIATDTYIYYGSGHIRDVQISQLPAGRTRTGDQTGVIVSTDGVTWTEIANPWPCTHTKSPCLVANIPYFIAGAWSNNLYKILPP